MDITKFTQDGQDVGVIQNVYKKVQQFLTPEENIIYIALRNKPLGAIENLSTDSVVATNRRLILFRPKLLGGVDMEDYIWRNVREVTINEGMLRATLTFKTLDGKTIAMDNLIKEQARRLYGIAQMQEENMEEVRRARIMEEKRVQTGGIVIQTASPAPTPVAPPPVAETASASTQEDALKKLKQLKEMLDAELITREEFDTKKADILARM